VTLARRRSGSRVTRAIRLARSRSKSERWPGGASVRLRRLTQLARQSSLRGNGPPNRRPVCVRFPPTLVLRPPTLCLIVSGQVTPLDQPDLRIGHTDPVEDGGQHGGALGFVGTSEVEHGRGPASDCGVQGVEALARELDKTHPRAAASLREGARRDADRAAPRDAHPPWPGRCARPTASSR
jgi:hypothetical protein